ncbi:MAG: hypothetical protein K0Q60_2441, partial [Microvirga sp.]|nr:hypothetical protein [Microvirga sp.]
VSHLPPRPGPLRDRRMRGNRQNRGSRLKLTLVRRKQGKVIALPEHPHYPNEFGKPIADISVGEIEVGHDLVEEAQRL